LHTYGKIKKLRKLKKIKTIVYQRKIGSLMIIDTRGIVFIFFISFISINFLTSIHLRNLIPNYYQRKFFKKVANIKGS